MLRLRPIDALFFAWGCLSIVTLDALVRPTHLMEWALPSSALYSPCSLRAKSYTASRGVLSCVLNKLDQDVTSTATVGKEGAGSYGVESAIEYLNSSQAALFMRKLALENKDLKEEAEKMNFWTGGNFLVDKVSCMGIFSNGIKLSVDCLIKSKLENREVTIPFPSEVLNEAAVKNVLVQIAGVVDCLQEAAAIMSLPFGQDISIPSDLRFNNVPHPTWVRSYLYDAVAQAVVRAVRDPLIADKSRLQLRANIPEVNPAYDTYRIGTVLEMVRGCALALAEQQGLRVRVCVQQSLGEGVFQGLPLAIASMRPILERMDWGMQLSAEEKFQQGDNSTPRREALIRLGAVGADQVQDDDDVFLVIAPQNVIGGMIVDHLEDMVKAANGRPLILINPNLMDRPSSNNMMQIRGRSERRAFADSFRDLFALRLLYPSGGGYMFPIQGMIAKRDFHSPWVLYRKEDEQYNAVAAFPPYSPPDPEIVSRVLMS